MSDYITVPKVKGKFPFRLGTTSYVYPDHILPNVRKLVDRVDDIQLILFEGQHSNLPSKEDIKELKRIANGENLTYTIHFPINYRLGVEDAAERQKAVDSHKYIGELTADIANLFVIHAEGFKTGDDVSPFLNRVDEGYSKFIPELHNQVPVCLENLSYPFEILDPIIEKYDLNVCLDNGHCLRGGHDGAEYWNNYQKRTKIIHFLGATMEKDHQALPDGDQENIRQWLGYLKNFKGTVCLEVFDTEDTRRSLEFMLERWTV